MDLMLLGGLRNRPVRHLLAALLVVLMACFAFTLFTRHNDFPEHYHWDEPTKVTQVLVGKDAWNFNHPLLLLETARRVWQLRAATTLSAPLPAANAEEEQRFQVVTSGRIASALLASIGVAALTLTAYLVHGFTGLWLTGLVLALCPPLLVYAHYFKEDTALICGLMVAVLGMRLVLTTATPLTQYLAAAMLGVGCALAISGKYVGAVTLVPALVALGLAPYRRPAQALLQTLVLLGVTLTGVLLINQAAFTDGFALRLSPQAQAGLTREVEHAVTGHGGVSLGLGNAFALRVALGETLPHLWVFGGLGLAWLLWQRQISRWGVVLLVTLLTWVVTLSFNTIPFTRYALPLSVLLHFSLSHLAVAAVQNSGRWSWRRSSAMLAATGAVVAFQGSLAQQLTQQFLTDGRQQLYVWIATNLPEGSRVLAEQWTSLMHGGDSRRHPVPAADRTLHVRAMELGPPVHTASDAAQLGFDYVAVAGMSFERYYIPGIQFVGQPNGVHPRRHFYDDLFARGELVWSHRPIAATGSALSPELRLYRVTALRHP